MAAVISVIATANGKETDGSPVVFSFSRTGSTDGSLSVGYQLFGAAKPGSDYSGSSAGTILFAAGSATATLSLPALADGALIDPGETIIARIDPSGSYSITPDKQFATATITAEGMLVSPKAFWGERFRGERFNNRAFAALNSDGSVVAWGADYFGGIAPQGLSGVTQIFSNSYAFAALKSDGSVVAWGDPSNGGSAQEGLSSGVTQIFSTAYAFAALKSDGSVVTWGSKDYSGTAPTGLSGVVGFANPYTNDRLVIDATPTYSLTPSLATINEGAVLTSTVATTNVATGTKFYYSLSGTGIATADFSAGALTGEGITDATGKFGFSHTLANDPLKEGIEILEIKLFSDILRTIQVGSTASVSINDASSGYSYYTINKPLNDWNIFTVDAVVKAGDIVNQWFGVETPASLQVQDPTESKLLDITTSSWTEKVKINRVAKASDKGDEIEGKQKDSSSSDIVGSVLTGGKGNDRIQGMAGWDMVDGGDGDDLVKTGNGRDILTGGTGRDELWGGFGWNTYKGDKDGFSDLIVIKGTSKN